MLQSLYDIKSHGVDIRSRVVNVLLWLVERIVNDPRQPEFRRISLRGDVIQNQLLPFAGAVEFLFEIGFVNDGNSLVLPLGVSADALTRYRQELLDVVVPNDDEKPPRWSHSGDFLREIRATSLSVLGYEDKNLQEKALGCLPPEDVRSYSNMTDAADPFHHERMILKLMVWFKGSFYEWFDAPECRTCRGFTCRFKQIDRDSANRHVRYAEIYECENCGFVTDFKRYGVCEQLLTTRKGRCGEWANCFTLICRALGWEARLVVDKTDHVWTEIWSTQQQRWVHCDPCETALDKPLMYEKGWGKKLSYVIAYSNEEVQDVTWRYTENSRDVMKRRTFCSENDLLETILGLSNDRQISLLTSRRKHLAERRLKECVELLFRPKNTDTKNYGGRTSGALTWRLARGETQSKKKLIWTPTENEIANKRFELKYSTSMNKYIHDNTTVVGWQNGVYSYSSLFRKEEMDWKKAYLCREENCEKSTIEWRFDFSSTGLVVQDITLICTTKLYNNGQVEWKLVGNDQTMNLPIIENIQEIKIDCMNGSDFVILSASLFGGSGEVAWQHSQIFRQSIHDQDYPFHILFVLKENNDKR